MTLFWLLLLLIVWFVWGRPRSVRTDQELARLQRELDDLRSRVRHLEGGGMPAIAPPISETQPLPPPPVPALPLAQPVTAPPARNNNEAGVLERTIGERWLLYAGVILVLLSVVFFLRYAFERDWLSPAVRVTSGVVAGVMLVVGGRQLSAAGYRNYGLSLAGTGFVVLYLSIYAALNFYALVSPPLAFALLVLVSVGAGWMADAEVSPSMAVVAVLGGFATPFLVGGHQDAQIVLFTYDAMLIAATTALAFRREWWYLNVLALALTVVTVGAWAAEYYRSSKALRTELFLTLDCVMFLVVVRASLRWRDRTAHAAAQALLAAPVLYHFASIGILYTHPEGFLTYLIVLSTVALLIAEKADLPVLRAIVWLAITVPFAEWLDMYQTHVAASVVAIAAIYLVYLAAAVQALHSRRWHPTVDTLLNDANGLAVFAELYLVLWVRSPNHLALIAAVLASWNLAIAGIVRRWNAAQALHWTGIAATLLAIAVALEFEGPWIVVMWGVEGAALTAIAIAARKPSAASAGTAQNIRPGLLSTGGWVLMLIAIVRWAAPDVQHAEVAAALVVNQRALSGLLLVALFYALALFEGARADEDTSWRIERAALFVWASVLTVVVISREIDVYWSLRAVAGEGTDVIRQAMLSAAWAIYAAVAISVGIRRRYPPIRYFAIALFGLTLAKVLVVDLDTLAGIDRIVAFLVIGAVLLFASFLYQKGRTGPSSDRPSDHDAHEGHEVHEG